jgi:hypothetical protein
MLNKAERNYCITLRELLAIMRTLEHSHKYLYREEFHLRTDHSVLTLLITFKNLEGQTTCWTQRLQEYSFTSEHHQGRKRPCREECTHCHKVEARANVKQIRAIAAVATAGWDIGPILEEVETRQLPEWKDIADHSPTYKSYWAQWKSLTVRNGILEHHWESDNGQSKIVQTVLSQSRVNDMLTDLHGGLSGGHLGINKTLNKVRQRYYWLKARNVLRSSGSATPVQPITVPEPGIGVKCISTMSGPHSKG